MYIYMYNETSVNWDIYVGCQNRLETTKFYLLGFDVLWLMTHASVFAVIAETMNNFDQWLGSLENDFRKLSGEQKNKYG